MLSLTLRDLHEKDSIEGSYTTEDHIHDQDIILGTKAAGTNNLGVWWNGYPEGYEGGYLYRMWPSYTGLSPYDLLAIATGNADSSASIYVDVVTAMRINTGFGGFQVWLNQGYPVGEGVIGTPTSPIVPNGTYRDEATGEGLSIAVGDLNADGHMDCVLGTRTAPDAGTMEVWFGAGDGTFSHDPVNDVYLASGEVRAVALFDMNADGFIDVAAGAVTDEKRFEGAIDVFLNQPAHLGRLYKSLTVVSRGSVNALSAGDMNADGVTDLVAGTRTGNKKGEIELWLSEAGGGAGTSNIWLADYAVADGPVLCVALGDLDYGSDCLDIAAGNSQKSVQAWFCDAWADSPGDIVPTYESWADAQTGGVVNAVAIARLECPGHYPYADPLNDVVVGTAVTDTSGEIVVYLNPYVWLIQP
ncbi:MAG: hypothetical protein AMJ46_04760 [Latescibacteria bacterium DG_63]|nr:MAG: hypothetical protein AMJ46_04760 [Latescibacteria bacterium DG_63]